MKPPRVDLRIDELVLHGLAGVHGPRLAAVVERELARLIAERGVPEAWREARSVTVDRVDGGTLPPARVAGRDGLGGGIARSLYDGLAGGER